MKPRDSMATSLLDWWSETPDSIHWGESNLPPLRKGGQGVFVMANLYKQSSVENWQITNLPSLGWRSQDLKVFSIFWNRTPFFVPHLRLLFAFCWNK